MSTPDETPQPAHGTPKCECATCDGCVEERAAGLMRDDEPCPACGIHAAAGARPEPIRLRIDAPDEWLSANDRRHHMNRARISKRWRETGEAAARAAGLPQLQTPVRIVARVTKPRGGRYDPHNLVLSAKPVIDGLVDAGVLEDDDHTRVVGPDMRHGGRGPAGLDLVIHQGWVED